MRTVILALSTFGVPFGMWLELGVRILSETTVIMEAAAAACVSSDGLEAVGLPMAVRPKKD